MSENIPYLKDSIRNFKINFAQNSQKRFESFPSLERLALIVVANNLWTQGDVRHVVADFLNFHHKLLRSYNYPKRLYYVAWRSVEIVVLDKMSHLRIPKYCKDVLEELVKWHGRSLLIFLLSLHRMYTCDTMDGLPASDTKKGLSASDVVKVMSEVRWTVQGTVNYLKTVELIIENTDLSKKNKFIIACNTCWKEKIYELHRHIGMRFMGRLGHIEVSPIEYYWNLSSLGWDNRFWNAIPVWNVYGSRSFIIDWAVRNNNIFVLQYFWNVLPDFFLERTPDLMELAKYSVLLEDGNILYFLLSEMTELEIEGLCQTEGHRILKLFLEDCRWRDMFMPVAKRSLELITKIGIMNALYILLEWPENVFKGQRHRLFMTIIDVFEQDIRINFKSICCKYFYLICLEDVEIIKHFLSKANTCDKLSFINEQGMKSCRYLAIKEKVDHVDLIIREMMRNPRDIKKCKRRFLRIEGINVCSFLAIFDKYDALDTFVKTFVAKTAVKDFKFKFICDDGEDILSQLVKKDDKDKFLNWCIRSLAEQEDKIPKLSILGVKVDDNSAG